MLKIYCSEFTKLWSEAYFSEKLYSLPKDIQFSIAKYTSGKERQLRIMGKLLLLKHLKEYGSNLSLEDITYDSFNRPSVPADIDFNIAHSGDIVVCAACSNARVGIDIENRQVPLNIEELIAELTTDELELLKKDPFPQQRLYEFWTRKEAMLKALGKGVFIPFNSINSIPATTSVNGAILHVLNVNRIDNYAMAIASNKAIGQLQFEMVNFENL